MNKNNIEELDRIELCETCGGGFAYDVGAVIGFYIRQKSSPGGIAVALAVWERQYSE